MGISKTTTRSLKMAQYLSNAFSLNMIPAAYAGISMIEVAPADIPAAAESVVGHADTANILSGILSRTIQMNRATLALNYGDVLYVAQYSGPRLPEGATSLPEGAAFRFLRVELRESPRAFIEEV
jgi:hypothetical protein